MSESNPQEIKEKIGMAYRAMEKLGIERQRVKPVLRRLLNEYDNHWEHIEAESYRVLADAIFEAQDFQEEGCSKDNNKMPPVTKGHREKKRLKSSEDPMPSRSAGRDEPTTHQTPSQNRAPAQKRPLSEQSTRSATNKQTPNNSALISRVDHAMAALPLTGERSSVACSRGTSCQYRSSTSKTEPEPDQLGCGPLAVVHPSYNGHSNSSRSIKGKAKGKAIVEPEGQDASMNLEIAATRDVNLSFICGDKLLSDPNFRTPSIEAVCQDVEERCLAPYRIIDPTFSLPNLFKEMCRSFSELGFTPKQKMKNGNMNIVPAPGAEHRFDDISRGEEVMKISMERNIGSREVDPVSFRYIARHITHQNAYINFSLSRIGDDSCCSDCCGDCLQLPYPCACASETGGLFAYTKEGVLRAEFLDACMASLREPKRSDFFYCKEGCPLERVKNEERPEECKGHLMRKFIKECWLKCWCDRKCGNRVVQRGITCTLQVFKTGEKKGWGVRTMENLPKGKFVCEYVGEILTNTELYERQMSSKGNARHTYPVLLDADWSTEGVLKDEEALCLDATHYGNIARFINHRCFDGNLIGIPVEIETPDHHYYHLAFFTTRDVSAMEELTWDYGIDFDDDKHPIKAFICRCESKLCRDNKRLPKDRSRKLVANCRWIL